MLKILLAGSTGTSGRRHLSAIQNMPDAVILATPTQVHAQQAIQSLEAGKHCFIEIPMADNLLDSQRVLDATKASGLKAMLGHACRFSLPHKWIHKKIQAGELTIQSMNIQTGFFRRSNINLLGEPRDWSDHLLWHHAAHSIDLFQYQSGESICDIKAVAGPLHPTLGIYLDLSILMQTPSKKTCTLSVSFNNDGPPSSHFRYVCDNGTYSAYYSDLHNGHGEAIDISNVAISTDAVELMHQVEQQLANQLKN